MSHLDVLGDGLEELHSGLLNTFVEHLTVLMEDQAVGCPVQLFIRQAARLLIVNLEDGVLDGFPVLLGLGALHIGVPHFVPVNQKLVSWKV